jgi:HD-like signal output (HDOD) protein
MSQRSPEDFRAAVEKVHSLYSIPPVLAKAMRLLYEPDLNLADLVDLVRRDAALAADLIHLSSSATFSRGGGGIDLHQAVQRLGLQEVLRAIGLSLSKNVFGKGLANYGITADQYWGQSVRAALLMEGLAQRVRAEPEQAYLVGILHAIGRVLINEALQELSCTVRWDGSMPLEEWELEHVGFTNAEAGALLLARWDFPEEIRQPIAGQFGPATGVGHASLTGLLRLTLLLLKPTGELVPREILPQALNRQTFIWSGFEDWDELHNLLVLVEESFTKVQSGIGQLA